MNILVVDDGKLNLAVAEEYIRQIFPDSRILLCLNPMEVMGLLAENEVDVVLLDIVMPEMSGIDVLRAIRQKEEYRDMQVVMLTSLSDKESFKTCFEAGANDYILKPIDLTEFTARLKATVKTRSNTLTLRDMFSRINQQNQELMVLNKQIEDTQFHMIQKEKLASIGELAAGVAHEINNPIGFIGSNLETMGSFVHKITNALEKYRAYIEYSSAAGIQPDELQRLRQEISEMETKSKLQFVMEDLGQIIEDSMQGIDRISKIVQTLRGFARTGLENEIEYCDLNKIIEEVLLMIRYEAKYSVDIKFEPADLSDVQCNRGQIGQVVLNILVNAIQAIKSLEREERGLVEIKTCKEEGHICCRICDNGPGIAPEIIGRIFDPFFTTKDVGKGTGLGLSISYDIIVKKHKGEFIVQSVPGQGAEFLFKLPV